MEKISKGDTIEIQLHKKEPIGRSSDELSQVLLARFGLVPRKKDGQARLHKLLLEMYERKKQANREKTPERAVMPVEEMALHAGIKRQTMYDHLKRWLDLSVLKKTSFVSQGKVVIGYELNGSNLESAFRKAEATVKAHMDASFRIIEQLQNEIKKEKLRKNITESSEEN
ncbi:hypothetical protein KY329_01110 [Candidatus Woesearchaeota archaeon]|nr:hypothetical protein [Candidatus Woesearchaeota archaeon]